MPRAHASSPRLEPHTVSPHKSGHWQEISIIVTVQIATGPTQLAKPKKPRCNKNTVDELKFKELVTTVYGELVSTQAITPRASGLTTRVS